MEQNVGLQKDDMSNNVVSRKSVCYVGFVVTQGWIEFGTIIYAAV
jgi:hypothetical protein